MADILSIDYVVTNQTELNLSYMPFIKNGGLFIPTSEVYPMGSKIMVHLQLPGRKEKEIIEGKIVWITPQNALYEIFPGIGVQFTGEEAKSAHEQIKANLDNTIDVGGYTYGITSEIEKPKINEKKKQ